MNENLESRGPLSDEPRGNQDGAAPSVGELEWCDRGNHSFAMGSRWTVHSYHGDVWYLTFEDDSEDAAVVATSTSRDGAKALANSLQRILSGAAE